MSNAPKVRFAGFTGDWEQRKLIEFAEKAVDNRGKTPPLSDEGTHPLIEVAALGNGAPDYSKVDKYLDDCSFEKNLRGYIKEGDILFSTVGSIGLVSLMDSSENAVIAQNIVAFRARKDYLPKFLYSLFSTEENKARANRIVMGAVQPSIKVSQLIDVEYMVTNNQDEQRLLGDYFYSLDNLITLHQREYEKLVSLKSACLDKMFPKNGSKVPELRFAGFTGDWEQRKLGELATITTGKLDANAAKEDGEYAFFTCGKETLRTNTYSFEGEAILISGNGDLGFTRKYSGRFDAYQRTYVLQGFMVNYEYLEQAIHRFLPERIKSESFGGAMPYIKLDTLTNLLLPVASDQESEKVSSFFNSLDNLITLHQRKLEKLKQLKQSMLYSMFV